MSAPPPGVGVSVELASGELGELGIEVEASHCSGRVWPAAIVLKQYLDSDACISLSDDDAILELGAGTGWLALKMGSRFQSWTATETNEGGAFDRLRRNLSLGQSTSTDGTSSSGLNARALDWNDVDGFRVDGDRERQWDFVCGSDLVYSAEGADALARCLAQILSHMKGARGGDATRGEGRIAIAQTCGRWGGHGFDEALYRALRRNGLSASPVWGDTLADSDELRQHVVVFRIDKEEEATMNSNQCADDDWLDIEKDMASHPLLRAARLHAAKEAAVMSAMTEEERGEAEASRLFDELG